MNIVLINPMLMVQGPGTGIYTIFDFVRHLLLASTLMDNYSIIYLVNSKDLLKPRTFIPVTLDKTVEARLLVLLILGHSTCIIKRALYRVSRPNTTDLILKEVAMVKGFYINIVSEACLLESGI